MKNKMVFRSITNVLKKSIGLDLVLFFCVCGVILSSLIPPQILRTIIDAAIVPKDGSRLLFLAVLYMGVLLLIGIFDFMKEAVLTLLGQKITKEIRLMMMEKLSKIRAQYFSSNESGAVVSRFTNDVDTISTLFTSGIVGMIVDLLKIVGIACSIWIFSASLGMITLILLPVIALVTRLFQKQMLRAQIRSRFLVGRVNNHISESVRNIPMIKAYSKERYMEKRYVDYLKDHYKTIEKINFYDSVFPPMILLIRAFVIALIVLLSSKELNVLGISLGMVAASIELFSNLFTPIENLGTEFQGIQEAVSGIHRVNEFCKEPEDENKNSTLQAKNLIPDPKDVRLILKDLSFRYDAGPFVLKDINLTVHPQEKVSFAGRTGVGKSTLFRLILGLLKPTEGSISINGVDVLSIPNSEKRRIFGYVNQDFHLISGTVADQISLKDESITRAQIEKAIEFVGLTEYIASLENGLDTVVRSESLFSQGQKQLLGIARAIAADPPILLLDEITASLDSITEEKIVSVLQKAGHTHTILSISHRLSSMISSDTVVILENGRVKNFGSPETLLKTDEWYRSRITLENLTWG